jgi:Fusaric acid resistance protein-like
LREIFLSLPASLLFGVICEKRDLLKIAAVGQPGSVTGQAWVHKGIRTLLAVAPGLGFFVIKGDALGVGFAFAALCLSVAYNDQSFRPIHLVSMAGAAAGLMPVGVWLHEQAVLYVLGFALIGAGAVIVTRSRKLPPRVTTWCLIYVLYQSSELRDVPTALGFAALMVPAAIWTYLVCFWFWPHRSSESTKNAKEKAISMPLHAVCAALSMAVAGTAVFMLNLSHGNWAIWSAYTVIRPSRLVSLQRSARRTLGAVIGCTVGFLTIEALGGVPALITALTLVGVFFMVAIENYVLAVAVRSFLAPLAAIALHSDPVTTVEARFLGIAIGVTIGTLFTLLITRRITDQYSPPADKDTSW